MQLLDQDLAARNGAESAFYAPYNQVDLIRHVVVAYADGQPVSGGAPKEFRAGAVEIKRMYVAPA